MDYEFECEALADFKYAINKGTTNQSAGNALIKRIENQLTNDKKEEEMGVEEAL